MDLAAADLLYLFCTCTGAFCRFLPIERIEFSKSFENLRTVAARLPPPPPLKLFYPLAFPYGDSNATLHHLAKMGVDFIVLESAEARVLPTIGEWMAYGIPDPRAQIVYHKADGNGVRVVIYRWTRT